jgi:serine/threonine protein kinase
MIGKTISHYKILEKLGEGGMGIVYKAMDSELNRIVALKFLPGYLMDKPRLRTRLKREAQSAASLNHPNICTIYGFHETREFIFIVMEYVEGLTLKQLIEKEAPIQEHRAKEIIIQIAEGLSVAHQNGIIHRDIKSDNIMLTKDGTIKIMDFGLAKMEQTPTITRTKSPMGTVAYMSPELVKGEKVDHRADLWSLGVILFEMLTGKMPFEKDSDVATMRAIIGNGLPKLTKYNSDISSSIQYVFTTLLEKDAALRYHKAEDIVKDLKKSIKGTTPKLFIRKVRRNYKKIIVVIMLLILVSYFANYYYQTRINIPTWLKGNVNPIRLTNRAGVEKGKISPDGKYLAFSSEIDRKLYIKNISSGETFTVPDSTSVRFDCPAWAPDSKQIAYLADRLRKISIFDLEKKESHTIHNQKTGYLVNLDWSADGKKLVSTEQFFPDDKKGNAAILIVNFDGSASKELLIRDRTFLISHPVWHPDCKRILFYEYNSNSQTKKIRSIDSQTGIISPPLYTLRYKVHQWWLAGIRCSPDGKYLIFPEEHNNNVELFALAVNNICTKSKGDPIPVTNFAGLGIPSWPTFSGDGILCYGLETGSRDISVLSLDAKKARAGEKTLAVSTFTDRGDFDANWSPDGQRISFLSIKARRISATDLPPDIYLWDKKSEKLTKIDAPKIYMQKLDFFPDNNSLTFIHKAALWKLSLSDSNYEKLYPFNDSKEDLVIHSYDWGATADELFAIISYKEGGTKINNLIQVNIETKSIKILKNNIANPTYAEVRYSISSGLLAVRDIFDFNLMCAVIYIIDPKTKIIKIIGTHSSVRPQGQISWTNDGKNILYGTWDYDVKKFFHCLVSLSDNKTLVTNPIYDSSQLVAHPGQISPQGNEFIVSLELGGADIFMIGEK